MGDLISTSQRKHRAARLGVLLLLGACLLQVVAAWRPDLTERLYARRVYPLISRCLAVSVGALPFSLGEALLLGVVPWVAWRTVRLGGLLVRRRGRASRHLLAALCRTVSVAGPLYLLYVLSWGLNHQRPSFAEISGTQVGEVAPAELAALADHLLRVAGEQRKSLAEDDDGVAALPGSIDEVLRRAPAGFEVAARGHKSLKRKTAPPKAVRFPGWMSWLGITGIYLPWTAEANVNSAYPPPGIPFVACHELAHRHGFAREDEANYLGYLACRDHPDPFFRYSGNLAALRHVLSALRAVDHSAFEPLHAALSPAILRDLEAFREFRQRYESPLTSLANAVNDTYLKSQGQADGIGSYGRMVDLLVAEWRARR